MTSSPSTTMEARGLRLVAALKPLDSRADLIPAAARYQFVYAIGNSAPADLPYLDLQLSEVTIDAEGLTGKIIALSDDGALIEVAFAAHQAGPLTVRFLRGHVETMVFTQSDNNSQAGMVDAHALRLVFADASEVSLPLNALHNGVDFVQLVRTAISPA